MNRITIDPGRCTKCGLCVSICPVSVIGFNAESYPEMNSGKEFLCVKCGHCESYCPFEALSFDCGFETGDQARLEGVTVRERDLAEYLKNRRSVRHFLEKPVEKELIERAMEIVRYAPSGKNGQPVKWIMIHDTTELRRIIGVLVDWVRKATADKSPTAAMIPASVVKHWENGNDIVMRHAPHCAIAYVPENTVMGPAAVYDAIIALSHFDIVIPSLGFSGFWAGFFTVALRNSEELCREVGIPEGHIPCYAYGFGYPKYKTRKIPKRKVPEILWK